MGGYRRGTGYYFIISPYIFYHLVAVVVILLLNGKKINKKEKYSLYFYDFIMILGVILQTYFFEYYLIINACFSIGEGVIFLSMQNPEYDIDSRSRVYNQSCFEKYINELLI
jgi:hypothetical protein